MRPLFVMVLLASTVALGHRLSDSQLRVEPSSGGARLAWDLRVRDLHRELVLDADGDGAITAGEVTSSHPRVLALANRALQISAAGDDCELSFGSAPQLLRQSEGAVLRLEGSARCAGAGVMALRSSLFFEKNPSHRGVVLVGEGERLMLSAETPQVTFDLARVDAFSHFGQTVFSGAAHIFAGLDHLLFLLALLLPSVVRRNERGAWEAVKGFRPVITDVVRIVTAFTLAHSLTLSASSLGWLALPGRWVESAIAVSVMFAALNNLHPVVREGRWMAAFALGLLHGFGFSSSLAEAGLGQGGFLATLLGFNLGVELGQLLVVAIFLPLAFLLRGSLFYRRVLLMGGSAAILVVAALWFAERAFDQTFSLLS